MCSTACVCCEALARLVAGQDTAKVALGRLVMLNASLAALQRNARQQLVVDCPSCRPQPLAAELEALRQQVCVCVCVWLADGGPQDHFLFPVLADVGMHVCMHACLCPHFCAHGNRFCS